jgi:hypothetical protein
MDSSFEEFNRGEFDVWFEELNCGEFDVWSKKLKGVEFYSWFETLNGGEFCGKIFDEEEIVVRIQIFVFVSKKFFIFKHIDDNLRRRLILKFWLKSRSSLGSIVLLSVLNKILKKLSSIVSFF